MLCSLSGLGIMEGWGMAEEAVLLCRVVHGGAPAQNSGQIRPGGQEVPPAGRVLHREFLQQFPGFLADGLLPWGV